MLDRNMLELMNKDIDKATSLDEKEKLHQYLKENPEANVLYNELLKSEHMLDKLEDINPSPNLKKRILNSIDYNFYTNEKKESKFWGYLSSIFSGSKTSYALSFGVAIVVGFMILTAIFYNSTFHDELESYNTSGTIGLHKLNIVKSIDILSGDISGKIDVSRVNNFYGFDIKLDSPSAYKLLIEFDSNNLSLTDLNSVTLEQGLGYVQISGFKDLNYFLSFSAKDLTSEKFTLKIFHGSKELFKKDVYVSKN